MPSQSLDSLPGPFDHLLPDHVDKWVHFGLFFLESHFLFRSLRHGLPAVGIAPRRSATRATLLLGISMALLTEAGQMMIPGRMADSWDIAADVTGILAWFLCLQAKRIRSQPIAP